MVEDALIFQETNNVAAQIGKLKDYIYLTWTFAVFGNRQNDI